MATDKPRFTITLDEATFAQVSEYKLANGIATQSGAIQRLVEKGIEDLISAGKLSEIKKAPPISGEAMDVALAYCNADRGIQRAVKKLLDLDYPNVQKFAARSGDNGEYTPNPNSNLPSDDEILP